MMLAAGVSARTAADRPGHHSAGFTLDRYVRALESLDEDAGGLSVVEGQVTPRLTGVVDPGVIVNTARERCRNPRHHRSPPGESHPASETRCIHGQTSQT